MLYLARPPELTADFVAVGCFVESGGQILQLLRARDRKVEPCKWGSPAGRAENGETPEHAVLRELFEETGLRVSLSQIKKAASFFVSYPSAHFDYFVFKLCFPYKPEITLSLEHTAYVWIAPAEAKSLDLMLDEWDVIELVYQI